MQIESDQTVCPACGAEGLEIVPVLHHMMCAYVGPQYDFPASAAGYTCPKCRRDIVSGDPACEIVGTSAPCPMPQGDDRVATCPLSLSARERDPVLCGERDFAVPAPAICARLQATSQDRPSARDHLHEIEGTPACSSERRP